MRILAIGGCASVGKTTVAGELAAALGAADVVHVDDLRAAHEASAGPSFDDAMPDVWNQPPSLLCASLIRSTRGLHQTIAVEVNNLVAAGRSGVVEGEGVEPALMQRWSGTRVGAVYIIEQGRRRLDAAFRRRSSASRYLALSPSEQSNVVEMNRLYATWLRAQAEEHGQAWVPAQPWATLADRVFAAFDARPETIRGPAW